MVQQLDYNVLFQVQSELNLNTKANISKHVLCVLSSNKLLAKKKAIAKYDECYNDLIQPL